MSKSKNQTAEECLSDIKKLGNSNKAIDQIQELLREYPEFISGWLELGLIHRRLGDRKLALNTFEKAINLAPQNQQVKLELAAEQFQFNQITECRENIQELLEKNPKNVSAIIYLAKIHRKENKRTKALELFQKALEISPTTIGANINVAIELRDLGRFQEAEQQLTKAQEYAPNHFDILIQFAELENKRQDKEKALIYFQKAEDKYPERSGPGLKIAEILRDLNRFEEANTQLYKLIKKYPKKVEIHLSKIEILCDLRRFGEAKNHLELLYKKYPDDSRVLIHLGHLERKLGQRKKALHWFRLAQEKTSNAKQNLEVQTFAIEELRDLNILDEAVQLANQIIQQFPHNIRAQIIKGSILQKQLKLKEAVNLYKNILSNEPKHLTSRLELSKIYRQLGQVTKARSLLQETHKLLGSNLHTLIQLGVLNEALENSRIAAQCYQKACQEYPDNHQGYCNLANFLFFQGKTEQALNLLQKAQVKIPNTVPVLIRLIDFQIRLGNFEVSRQLLKDGLNNFPHNIELLWQLCRLYMGEGDYSAALGILDKISTDNQEWIRKTEQLKANIYFYLYDYQKAEQHLKKAISLATIATGDRNRLGTILMLTGRIEEAYQEFKIATEELTRKNSLDQTLVPFRGNPAMITNELRMNPPLMAKLQAAQQETEDERILELGSILAKEPTYLGSALYLARELRVQGIFDKLQQALSQNVTSSPTIPRRIVQFWDESEPPPEIERICQSWRDFNPEYEYIRFSLETTVAFLKKHYDSKVLNAFENCDQAATQADFFRLAYLNKMGGFYADADDLCRQSLDIIVNHNPELVILQEDFACFGNNFLACIPGQTMIHRAFYQAVNNLSDYCNESPWFKTGPGLITSVVCSGLLPYLSYTDYQVWPRILVLTQTQLRKIINQHVFLHYKRTAKNWQHNSYRRKIKVMAVE